MEPFDNSHLLEVKAAGAGAKPVQPITGLENPQIIGRLKPISQALLPASIAAGAGGSVTGTFVERKGIELITGLKIVGEAGAAKLAPAVGSLFFPAPIGVLPERFFQGKPRIPGTQIYFDPLYTIERQIEKHEADRRHSAAVAQEIAFTNLVEDLSDDDLKALARREDLKRQYLTFIPSREVDAIIRAELEIRRQEQIAAGKALYAAARARRLASGQPYYLDDIGPDDLLAANPPDP